MTDLRSVESHFKFGDNWSSYSTLIDADRISRSVDGLIKLFSDNAVRGRSFLDIGCGSGLHSLSALLLGAKEIVAIDLDAESIKATEKVLATYGAGNVYQVTKISVFDLPEKIRQRFDVVYSWGVLHHTGAMAEAISCAAAMVAPNGVFAFALYRKTPFCGFWRIEKKWYADSSPYLQRIATGAYVATFRLACLLTGRSFKNYVAEYKKMRGMEFLHDVHDWLGGYPYESIAPPAVDRLLRDLGFSLERRFVRVGFLATLAPGCDEYVYRKVAQ
jgi:2-polyprenyl-6-hydroxyphenyl methylase/3-demethylubiquinone-9 3-methyltransferase